MAYTQVELNHYKRHPEEITSALDFGLILELIDLNPKNIKKIKPQTIELIEQAYLRDPQVFRYIDFSVVSPSFLDRVIGEHPTYIRYITYPSPELIKKSLLLDINSLPYVEKYVTESMFEWLVSRNGLLLQFIPETKQTINMTRLAIENNIEAYQFAYKKSKETDIYVVERDLSKIPLISFHWPEIIDHLVEYNPNFITDFFYDYPGFVTPPRLKKVLDSDPQLFRTIPEPSMDIMKYTLRLNIDMFIYMPTKMELLDHALETNGLMLKFYKKKSLKTIKTALATNSRALDYLQYPRQFLIDYAFEKNGYALKYFKNPTYDQCLDAVNRNWEAIEFVPDAFKTREMQLNAISSGGTNVLPFLGAPKDDDVVMQVLNLEPSFIFKLENPTSLMYQIAFKIEGKLMLFYPNWNSKFNSTEIGAALGQDGTIFQLVKNKTKPLALIAIKEYPPAVQWTISFQDLEIARTAVRADPRTLFFIRKDVLDSTLLELALRLDPDYFTRETGEMTWEEWLNIVNL
jgi:hypothetical protein